MPAKSSISCGVSAGPGRARVRERTAGNDIPAAFRGFPFALISASLLALAFTGFSGLSLPL